jgi:cytochrome c-type biogenesis protein CcmH
MSVALRQRRGAAGRLALALVTAALTLGASPALAAGGSGTTPAHAPRASLTTIESQVMCVSCKIPLEVAESKQANDERAFIQELIDKGQDEAEVKRSLVGQYGKLVLALPKAEGFDLAVYLVPVAVVLLLLAALAVLLPRWRRDARVQAASAPDAAGLSASDAARLDSDLARFD